MPWGVSPCCEQPRGQGLGKVAPLGAHAHLPWCLWTRLSRSMFCSLGATESVLPAGRPGTGGCFGAASRPCGVGACLLSHTGGSPWARALGWVLPRGLLCPASLGTCRPSSAWPRLESQEHEGLPPTSSGARRPLRRISYAHLPVEAQPECDGLPPCESARRPRPEA